MSYSSAVVLVSLFALFCRSNADFSFACLIHGDPHLWVLYTTTDLLASPTASVAWYATGDLKWVGVADNEGYIWQIDGNGDLNYIDPYSITNTTVCRIDTNLGLLNQKALFWDKNFLIFTGFDTSNNTQFVWKVNHNGSPTCRFTPVAQIQIIGTPSLLATPGYDSDARNLYFAYGVPTSTNPYMKYSVVNLDKESTYSFQRNLPFGTTMASSMSYAWNAKNKSLESFIMNSGGSVSAFSQTTFTVNTTPTPLWTLPVDSLLKTQMILNPSNNNWYWGSYSYSFYGNYVNSTGGSRKQVILVSGSKIEGSSNLMYVPSSPGMKQQKNIAFN